MNTPANAHQGFLFAGGEANTPQALGLFQQGNAVLPSSVVGSQLLHASST